MWHKQKGFTVDIQLTLASEVRPDDKESASPALLAALTMNVHVTERLNTSLERFGISSNKV